MRNFFAAGLVILVALASCRPKETSNSEQAMRFDTTTIQAGTEFYQCPMDPEEISDKEGNCNKCGMPLEKKIKS